MFILLLAALLLLLLGWNIYYRRHWYRQVDVTLDFDRTSVYAGEQVELTEVITNRKAAAAGSGSGFPYKKGTGLSGYREYQCQRLYL